MVQKRKIFFFIILENIYNIAALFKFFSLNKRLLLGLKKLTTDFYKE